MHVLAGASWGATQIDNKLTLVDWIYTAEKRHEVAYTTGAVEAAA